MVVPGRFRGGTRRGRGRGSGDGRPKEKSLPLNRRRRDPITPFSFFGAAGERGAPTRDAVPAPPEFLVKAPPSVRAHRRMGECVVPSGDSSPGPPAAVDLLTLPSHPLSSVEQTRSLDGR
jgi:hypothetical protein